MSVSRRLRFEILRRDDHTCHYCGATAPEAKLTVDHVVPVALGGDDTPNNLVAACKDCNAGKSSVQPDQPLVDDVDERAARWSSAMRWAAEIQLGDLRAKREVRDEFDRLWREWRYNNGQGDSPPRPLDWPTSIEHMVAAGLTIDDLGEMIQAAMRRDKVQDKWRYFCGCAWTRLRQRQEMARRLLEQPEAKTEPVALIDSMGDFFDELEQELEDQ